MNLIINMKIKFDQPLQLDMDKKQTVQTTVTLLSQMLGACLLSCSFIVAKLGWVLALFAFTFSVGYDLFVYNYLVKTSCYTQAQSYRQLTERALSKKLSMVLEISKASHRLRSDRILVISIVFYDQVNDQQTIKYFSF
ncbi:Amino_acid transporter family protein [Hexamita inflata]|uniref:Amino acid transporter family protein n=1 Tax=Hexamita inflata TaxID=28002 RepID=A0AA86UUY3_9EUKA|nr:Amino acid transporter family protein [Hexamita inflata]